MLSHIWEYRWYICIILAMCAILSKTGWHNHVGNKMKMVAGKLTFDTNTDWVQTYWSGKDARVLPVIVMFALLYGLVWICFPDWAKENLTGTLFFSLVVVAIFAAVIRKRSDEPFKYTLGNLVLYSALVLLAISFLHPYLGWIKNGQSHTVPNQITPNTSTLRLAPTYTEKDEEPGEAEIAKKTLAKQPDLLQVCREESGGLRQHKFVDGRFDKNQIIHGINPDGSESSSIGICQINVVANGSFCSELKLNPTETQGNVDCALALYKKYGLTPWYTDPRSPDRLIFLLTITGELSPLIQAFNMPCKAPDFDMSSIEIKHGDDSANMTPSSSSNQPPDYKVVKGLRLKTKDGSAQKGTVTCATHTKS